MREEDESNIANGMADTQDKEEAKKAKLVIADCPVCGKCPEVWCADEEARIRIVCCRMAAYTTLGWNKYAAAMKMADIAVALEEAMKPLNAGEITMKAALPGIKAHLAEFKMREAQVHKLWEK